MASQEDYANVLLALTTLATAPVAAYPESGPMMLAQQGQDRAVGKLADEAIKKAQKKAKKKGKTAAIGQAVGTIGGTLIGGPIGGAVGGNLGYAAGGGSFDPASVSAAFTESSKGAEGALDSSLFAQQEQWKMRKQTKKDPFYVGSYGYGF